MRKLTDKEIKERLCLLLKEFDEVCTDHSFCYYLAYGSLLGAVRHGGFIPWDDDIDVCMPQQDYDRFINFCRTNPTSFRLFDRAVDTDYFYYYAKISDPETEIESIHMKDIKGMGVFIDIFPLNPLNLSSSQAKFAHRFVKLIHFMMNMNAAKKYWRSEKLLKNICKYFAYLISKVFGWNFWYSLKVNYVKKLQKKHGEGEQYLSATSIVNKAFFGKPQRISFESVTVNVPEKIDDYLTFMYKDYMKIPPVTEQKTEHDYVAYMR